METGEMKVPDSGQIDCMLDSEEPFEFIPESIIITDEIVVNSVRKKPSIVLATLSRSSSPIEQTLQLDTKEEKKATVLQLSTRETDSVQRPLAPLQQGPGLRNRSADKPLTVAEIEIEDNKKIASQKNAQPYGFFSSGNTALLPTDAQNPTIPIAASPKSAFPEESTKDNSCCSRFMRRWRR